MFKHIPTPWKVIAGTALMAGNAVIIPEVLGPDCPEWIRVDQGLILFWAPFVAGVCVVLIGWDLYIGYRLDRLDRDLAAMTANDSSISKRSKRAPEIVQR